MNNADQAEVQPHVSVENMAELVRDHSLEFLPGEIVQASARDRHHGVVRVATRGKGIDPGLVLQDVDGRHMNAGGQRHFLDHVQ